MLVTEANAVTCPEGFTDIGGSCIQLWTFQFTNGQSRVSGEDEAEMATMINMVKRVVPSGQPDKVEIVGNTDMTEMVKKKVKDFGVPEHLIEVRGVAPRPQPRMRTRPMNVPVEVKMIVPPLP
jgi:hypothetical protein